MQLSSPPVLVPLPWGSSAPSGNINVIPLASQIGITNGLASLTDGFPPLTFTPVTSGGVPPFGADFNGILNLLTQTARWVNAGGTFQWNSAFSAAIGGYPKGAVVLDATGTRLWICTTDNNTSNPDSLGAGWNLLNPLGSALNSYTSAQTLGIQHGTVYGNCAGGAFNLTLPASATVPHGIEYAGAKTDSVVANPLGIVASGSDVLTLPLSLTPQYSTWRVKLNKLLSPAVWIIQ